MLPRDLPHLLLEVQLPSLRGLYCPHVLPVLNSEHPPAGVALELLTGAGVRCQCVATGAGIEYL